MEHHFALWAHANSTDKLQFWGRTAFVLSAHAALSGECNYYLTICGLQYVNFPALIAALIIAVLQAPYSKGTFVTASSG